MKRFTRKISAFLVATLLFMTVVPNLAYANDDIDFAAQSETVVESTSEQESAPVEESAPETESTPVEESTPETESTPVEESAPGTESTPVEESLPETESTPVEESAPDSEAAPAIESTPETEAALAPAEESTPESGPASVVENESEADLVQVEENKSEPEPGTAVETVTEASADTVKDDIQEAAGAQSSDQNPVIANEPATENTSADVCGGDANLQNETTVKGTNYKADEVLITPENLTVLLRGLSENNKVNTMLGIDKYINLIVQQKKSLEITGDSFVDAEKFSTGTPGFDSQHCWAATASNILWTTGYAQQAVNPQTGKHFMNEDEVLAYFTANFTDYPGVPEDGVNWFMQGTSAYGSYLQNTEKLAHYTDANSGGLLKNAQTSSNMLELWNGLWDAKNPDVNKGDPKRIESLLSVCSQGMGVLVKWYENNKISSSAHWMTVVGTIIDETTNVLADKYKALIVADSDSNPVHREAGVDFNATTLGQKIAQKANCVNAYTVYRLEFIPQINGNGAWNLVGFGENANRKAIVSYLYYLLDSDKEPQGDEGGTDANYDYSLLVNNTDSQYSTDGMISFNADENVPQSGPCQPPVVEENKEAVVITDGQNTIIIAKEDILRSLTETELDKSENLANLLEYMVNNQVEIFSRTKGIVSVSNEDNYVSYIRTPVSAKLTVSVDGIVLPEDAYEIIVLPNGMTKLIIKNSYLKVLSLGTHNLQIISEGVESVINSSISVLE